MGKVKSITPPFHPLALLEANLERAKNSKAAALVILGKDGELHYDCCGVTKESLLWAIENMKKDVLG